MVTGQLSLQEPCTVGARKTAQTPSRRSVPGASGEGIAFSAGPADAASPLHAPRACPWAACSPARCPCPQAQQSAFACLGALIMGTAMETPGQAGVLGGNFWSIRGQHNPATRALLGTQEPGFTSLQCRREGRRCKAVTGVVQGPSLEQQSLPTSASALRFPRVLPGPGSDVWQTPSAVHAALTRALAAVRSAGCSVPAVRVEPWPGRSRHLAYVAAWMVTGFATFCAPPGSRPCSKQAFPSLLMQEAVL